MCNIDLHGQLSLALGKRPCICTVTFMASLRLGQRPVLEALKAVRTLARALVASASYFSRMSSADMPSLY